MLTTKRRKTSETDSIGRWAPPPPALDNRGRRVQTASPWTTETRAILLTVVFSAIYLATRTAYHSIDAVRIASDILSSERTHGIAALVHPGYLIFGLIGAQEWRLAEMFHYTGGAIPVLSAANCIWGGIGIGALSLLLRTVLTRSRALTMLVPIALGFSFGYWMIATDARAEMPATAISIVASYLLVRAMVLPTRGRAAAAGLVVAIASLFHIVAALFLIVGSLALCLGEYTQGTAREENQARLRNVGVFLLAGIVPIAIAYVALGIFALHLTSLGRWETWISVGFARDWWWSPHPLQNLRLDAYAFRRALFVEPGPKSGTFHLSDVGGAMHAGLFWIALLLWFIAAYAIASTTAFLVRTHYGSFLIVALTAGGLYALVFTFVSPGYFIYWVPVTIVSSVIMAICCSYFRGRRRGSLWLVGIGCWTAIFAASNFIQFIGPHLSASANPNMVESQYIEGRTKPGDLIVVSGFGNDTSLEAYLPYFAHRTVFSIRENLEQSDGDITSVSADLQARIAQTLSRGDRAYATGDLWADPDIRERLRDEYQLHGVQQLFGSLQRAPAWQDPGDPQMIFWKLLAAPPTAPQTPILGTPEAPASQ